MTSQNRSKFLKGEGLQLMNLMLRYIPCRLELCYNKVLTLHTRTDTLVVKVLNVMKANVKRFVVVHFDIPFTALLSSDVENVCKDQKMKIIVFMFKCNTSGRICHRFWLVR